MTRVSSADILACMISRIVIVAGYKIVVKQGGSSKLYPSSVFRLRNLITREVRFGVSNFSHVEV